MATLSELLEKRKSRENEANNSSSNEGENYYSLSDLLEKRRTRKAYEAGRLGVMMSPVIDRINTYIENGGNYIGEYYDRYGLDPKTGKPLESEGDGYVYRDDTEDYLNKVTGYRDSMATEAEQLGRMFEYYKPYLNEGYYKYVTEALSGYGNVLSEITDYAQKDYDYYSKFENEEAYLDAWWRSKFAQKYSHINSIEDWQNEYEPLAIRMASEAKVVKTPTGLDIVYEDENKERELEYLKGLGEYLSTKYYDEDGTISDSLKSDRDYFYREEYVDGAGADLDEIEAFDRSKLSKSELDARQREHDEKIKQRDLLRKMEEYEAYTQSPDFETLSKYTSNYKEGDAKVTKDGWTDKPTYSFHYSDNIDPLYEYINRNETVVRMKDYEDMNSWKTAFGVDNGFLKELNDHEISLYNYLYHLDKMDGGGRANEYIELLTLDLKDRRADRIFEEYLEGNTLGELLSSIPAGLSQFTSGIDGIFKDEYDPSINALVSEKVRKDLADDGKILWYDFSSGSWEVMKVGGNSGAQALYDIGSTAGNMLPSILVSLAVEAALPTYGEGGVVFAGLTAAQIGAAAGAVTTGASAMGNAKQEMLSYGYSADQATAYGLMVGASEAGLSYLLSGIPGLRGGDGVFSALGQKAITKVDNAIAKAAIALGGDMLDEGLEEGLQTVLESWFKEIATGVDWEDPSIDEILYSSLLGALTAAGFGGGKLAIDSSVDAYKTSKVGKGVTSRYGQSGVSSLTAQGLGLNQNTAAYKQAGKIQTKLDAGKSASNYSVGKLLSSMSESQTSTAVQTRLSAHIENKAEVRKLSNTITDILYGREVSDKAIKTLAANKYALNTLNDVLGSKLNKGATASDVKAAVKSYQEAGKSESGVNASVKTQQGSEVKILGRSGATFSVSENADGKFDVVAEADGESRALMSFKSQKQAQAAVYAYTLGMGAEGLKGLATLSENLPDGVDLGEAAIAFNAFYNQGKNGKAFSAAKNMELLSPEQRQYAYNLGIMDKALDGVRAKKEGGSPPVSDVQNSSSLTHHNTTPAVADAELSEKNDGKVLQKDGKSGKMDTATTEMSPKRKGRTAEERQEARKRQIEAERRRFSQLSPERQKYLKEKYSEYRNVIEQLEVGDKLIPDSGVTIGEVVSISDGIVFIAGENGFVEMILPDTFTADGVISFLDVDGGHFEKPDGTWIGGSKNNAIWQYKSSESYKINEAIRSGRELTDEESAFVEELDRELEKTPKYSGVVYRNMTFDFQGQEVLDDFVAGHSSGSIVTYPAYTSTSKSKEGYIVEGELLVHLEIYGENGHDVSKGYGIEEEQEVLFDRNTDFYVCSVSYDGKTANIVLEEVAYGEKEVSGIDKGNNPAQQGYNSQGGASEVQRMQTSKQMDVQKVSQRNSKRNYSQSDNLQGVRGEVNDNNPDVQQAKSDQASSSEWSTERIKDGKAEKAKPISEIIERIRHDFGIHITKGHVRGKGVLGQYSRKNHGIRTKIANDLPTVSHELGHALDQRYGLTDKSKLTKEMKSELVNALGDLKNSYKQNLWVSEGFAEYIRRFLQNRDDATRSYPEFTKHFLNSLSKADRILMDTFADEINAYYALDADTATSSIRLREEGTSDARTALEKAKEMGDGVYQAWVDANHGIRLFDEATGGDTYKLATNAAYSDAIAGQIITGDLTDANGQYVAPGLKSALEGVDIGNKQTYREFGEYLVLRHGPERLNEGMMIFADPRKNTAAFMAERQAELEAAHPEFKEAADRLYEFQRQFLKTWAVDTGLLPAEVAEAWAKRWSFYVPLNRAVGKAGTIGAKRGYVNQNSTVKKAMGSGLDIVHPVDNIINNIVKMVNAGVRNNVMLAITAQAEQVGADAAFLEKVPTPMKKKTADLTGVKAKLHDAFGAAGIDELLAEVEANQENSKKVLQKQSDGDIIGADTDSLRRVENGTERTDEFRAIQERSREMSDEDSALYHNGSKKLDSSKREGLRLAFEKELSASWSSKPTHQSSLVNRKTGKTINILEGIDGNLFHDIFEIARIYLQNGELVDLHDNYDNATCYISNDGLCGFAIENDGNLVSVFNLGDGGFLDTIAQYVKDKGATHLDCYNSAVQPLTLMYERKLGFKTASIMDYNMEYDHDDIAKNHGMPKVAFMVNTEAEVETREFNKDQYDEAVAYQRSFVDNNVYNRQSGNGAAENTKTKSEAWSQIDDIIESTIDDVLVQYGQGKAHGDVVTVLRNGKQEFWKINDALLLESLTNMSQKKMNGILEAYAVVSRFMTSNITGNNIVWSIFSNFPRDLMTFFTYSKQKNPLKAFPAMGEAYLNKVTGGKVDTKNLPYIKEYYALGGGQTSAYTADVDLAKRARKKIKNSTKLQNAAYYANPLNTLSFISETVESGPRIATYIMMREQGMSPQEAFYESQDITVNFKRGGRLSREFNKAVPFFNASVQGLDKFRRWITCADVPKATRAKAIVGRVTVYVAVSAALGALFYALNNWDDEDEENYRLLSNYTKNTYWCIPLGDGKYFAIPKPREIAVLSTFFETTCEYFGGNDYAYDGFGEYVADNFLPPFVSDFVTDGLDGALGSLGMIGVVSDLRANKDFLGRPIESTSLQGYEPKDRYTRRTSMIAYWLGQAAAELGLDWSPVQIDYFFGQTLGGYWKVQKALFPVGSENVDLTLGVQNTYIKDNQYSNDIVNWLYDEAGASAMAKKSNPDDMDIAIDAKLDDNMKAFYSRYYALTKGQKEDSASRRAKRVVLDMIIEYRKATDNGDRSAAEKAVYDIVAACGDTSLLPAVMQSTVKDSNKNEIKLTDIQYVEYQTVYNDLYWSFVVENLDAAKSEAEKIAILKQAQSIAKERATESAIKNAGGGSSGFFDKYSGIEDSDLVTFKTKIDLENDKDGSVNQAELIAIIQSMVDDGLSNEDAYTLFKSRYPDSDKNNPWRRYAP